MKQNIKLLPILVKNILLISLLLQGCSGPSTRNISNLEKDKTAIQESASRLEIIQRTLLNEEVIAHGSERVIFYNQDGELRADVKEGFSPLIREHISLPVYIDEDTNTSELCKLKDEQRPNRYIQVDFTRNNQLGVPLVRVGCDVIVGGMKRGNKKGEDDEEGEKEKDKNKDKDKGNSITYGFKELFNAANDGNVEAQYIWALKLIFGNGNNKKDTSGLSLNEPFNYLSRAAFSGFTPAVELLKKFGIDIINDDIKQDGKALYRQIPRALFSASCQSVGMNDIFITQFKNYCNELFSNINSFETYQENYVIIYMYDLISSISCGDDDQDSNLIGDDVEKDIFLIKVFSILISHIENIISEEYFEGFPLTDKKLLLDRYYYLLHKTLVSQALIAIYLKNKGSVGNSKKERKETNIKLNTRFKKHKDLLSVDYVQLYKDFHSIFVEPKLHSITCPNSQGRKIGGRRTKRDEYNAKKDLKETKELFNYIEKNSIATPAIRFNTKYGEFLALLEGLSQDASLYQQNLEISKKSFLDLEHFAFSLIPSLAIPNYESDNLTGSELVSLYEGLKKLDIDPYGIIKYGIILARLSSNCKEGFIRLKATENFYTSTNCPKDFDSFIAHEYAYSGEYDKITQFAKKIILKKIAQQKVLRERHQKKIALIKTSQCLNQVSVLPTKLPSGDRLEKEKGLNSISTESIESISELAHQENLSRRKEAEEERIKRHQQAEHNKQVSLFEKPIEKEKEVNTSSQTQTLEAQPTQLVSTDDHTPIHFLLAPKACGTVDNIFSNNWKISRKDIENLFNELGHNINTATKSSHHIINISSAIFLVDQEGQVKHMIPNLSAETGGHLSLPSWVGIVPIYMRSQIKTLLSAIGLNEGNYSKGNSDSQMQFIPVANNSEGSNSVTTSTTSSAKKKRNRKKKKNLS